MYASSSMASSPPPAAPLKFRQFTTSTSTKLAVIFKEFFAVRSDEEKFLFYLSASIGTIILTVNIIYLLSLRVPFRLRNFMPDNSTSPYGEVFPQVQNYTPYDYNAPYPTLNVALGFFLEIRTLSDGLRLWKRYLIDKVKEAGGTVDIFVSVATRNLNLQKQMQERKLFWRAIDDAGLAIHVVSFDFYVFAENHPFVLQMMEIMEQRHNESSFLSNAPGPLFAQYYMRHQLNQMLSKHMYVNKRKNYDLVLYSRSDIAIGSPLLDDVVRDITNNATQWERFVWQMANGQYGVYAVNDRINVFTNTTFYNYQNNFVERLEQYVRTGKQIHGETMHGAMLLADNSFTTRNELHNLLVCYGVKRYDCSWLNYGEMMCKFMRLKAMRDRNDMSYLCPLKETSFHIFPVQEILSG